ncbi:MAG: hypothetical protein H7258_07830 [Ferruginibacter sp.]|nr:hypothetical protein [Ferruginibacter sp.]
MDKIISTIFLESNHDSREADGFHLFSLKEQANYWVVITRQSLADVLEEQVDLFLKAKGILGEARFDKNANLLILYPVQAIDKVDRDKMLQVEEDLYHFKKSVIYYTESERDNLLPKINGPSMIKNLETLILREDIFKKHKEEFDSNMYESLLYRLAHKIPFIKINVGQANNLESLEEMNKGAISENKLNEILENGFFNISETDFNGMSPEKIMEKIKTALPNEN